MRKMRSKMRKMRSKMRKMRSINAKNAKQKCEKCGKTNNKSFLYTSHVRTTHVRTHDVTGYNLTLTSGTRRVRTQHDVTPLFSTPYHVTSDPIWGV
jgi:hypothetical protein